MPKTRLAEAVYSACDFPWHNHLHVGLMSRLVHIVDDDADFRAAIARFLQVHGYDTVEYQTADSFFELVRTGMTSGCILLDVGLPGLSGPDLQARLARVGSPFPIVFLTGRGEVSTTVRAIKAGAEDFLTKPVSAPALLDSIDRAFQRHEVEKAQREWLGSAQLSLQGLTPREREVFDYVVRGELNKQTAHALGITERTVKAHRQHIFEKLHARSVIDLVSLAVRLGIVSGAPTVGVPQDAGTVVRSRIQREARLKGETLGTGEDCYRRDT